MFLFNTFLSFLAIATATSPPSVKNPDITVHTERWGEVESTSLNIFHDAYALFAEKEYKEASLGFFQLIDNTNYHLADEAKWYYAESLLLSSENIELAFELYFSLALDEKSVWSHVARDKLVLSQFKSFLVNPK